MTWSKFDFKRQAVSGKLQALGKPRAWRYVLACCLWLTVCGLLSGCGIYSFNGTNIDPAVRTISIATIQNNSPQGPAFLTQRFTEDLKDYFQRNTSLKLVPRDGDIQFDGSIVAYDYAPAAIQKVDNVDLAGSSRLTIQVKVHFVNSKDEKASFDQVFQSFGDFPSTQDVAAVNNDQAAVRKITNNIITDIFNKSVANW